MRGLERHALLALAALAALTAPAALAALPGCGAKTGLTIDGSVRDAGRRMDAGLDAGPDAGPICIPFRAEARLASLDIFVLMDSSGSMEESTASGLSKAAAITEALEGFFFAPESEGIGVGLTFFPFHVTSVPEYCTSDASCGEPGACLMPDICLPSGEQVCRNDADCRTAGDRCEPLGRCSDVDESLCVPSIGLDCPDGSPCVDYGFCENRTSCDVEDYARPIVDIGLLPAAAPALVDALVTRPLVGGTPTLPALEGGLLRAGRWSADNPGSKVIVLLATDGFPTTCDPTVDYWDPPDPSAGIPNLVAAAARGAAEGLQTFVVGVFTPEDEADARRNLSAIAVAGGTDEALVVTTTEPVTERLLEILNELRRSVRTCVYAIPAEGALPDPYELEVRILPPMGDPIELTRREGPESCDPMTGGFYFEEDIAMGARPGYVELCPASCSITAASPEFIVEMQAGCD